MKSCAPVNRADELFFLPRDQFFPRQTDSQKEDDIVSGRSNADHGLSSNPAKISRLTICLKALLSFARAVAQVLPGTAR
jgi:hypothetical protein